MWFLNAYERIRFNPDRGRIKFSNIPDTPEARSGGAGPQVDDTSTPLEQIYDIVVVYFSHVARAI